MGERKRGDREEDEGDREGWRGRRGRREGGT